jgi:transketolase
MRNAFAQELKQLAEEDPRVVVLSGDIGNRLFDNLKARCPDRFFNCGVAEANMVGMAAGLALSGLRPVCYTIAPFITYRCLEQIRVDLCYHQAPVVIVGTGAGLAYASLGATHHSCEDMGMLRLLPGLAVVAPADVAEVRGALRAALRSPHPVYVRIGKKGEPVIHQTDPHFEIGKAITLREGTDVCLLSIGTMLSVALQTADQLQAQGLSVRVVSFHTLKPLDEETLISAFSHCRLVVTMEEHSVLGGLGGSVAEWLTDHPQPSSRLLRCGTADEFLHETANQQQAREYFGLTALNLVERIQSVLNGSPG